MSQSPPETVVETRTVFDGRLIKVVVETVRDADGRTTTREIVEHPGAVGIVAPDATGRVAMVRQWRSALRGWTLEIPAGTREPNESAEACAARELSEETGLRAANWSSLGDVYTSPGWCNEQIRIFLATDLSPAEGHPEADELIACEWIGLATVPDLIASGEIRDAKSVTGLLSYLVRSRGG
jgi:ADP-ribose pyrophosphatase